MKKKIYLLGLVVVLIDQLVKLLVSSNLTLNSNIPIIKNFFNITYVQNEGASWNLFYGERWFLIIISLVALYAIIKYFLIDIKVTKLEMVAYGFVLGGIVGNLIDRVFLGYVIDYLNFNIIEYDFPVFNIADSCIVIGVILICYTLIKGSKK